MSRSDWVYLGHMLDMCVKGISIAAGKSYAEYEQDDTLKFALAHVIQVIGEAADHVSLEFTEQHPEIPWREIVGMRHRIVHDYMNLDEDIVWSVVQNDLRPLINLLLTVIPPEMQ